jgi:hypothetical protein
VPWSSTGTQKSTGALLCFNYSPENRVPLVIPAYSFPIMVWKELKSLPITGVPDLTKIFGNPHKLLADHTATK